MIEQIPEEPGKKYALAFTVLVHVGLILALFLGVQWKSSKPEVMEVELWSATPTPATYVPPPPPPPPEPEVKHEPKPIPRVEPKPEPVPAHKPEIVVKKEEKKPEPKKPEPKPEPPKPEPKKPELKKPEPPKPEAKPQPKFDFDKELAKETNQLKSTAKAAASAQQMANAAAAEAEQRASSNKRGLDNYVAKIRSKIHGNIVLPPGIQGNPEAVFEVSQLPSREILEVRLKRSSGNPTLDAAFERAIRKSSPLPPPDDPSLFKRELELRFKPHEE